MRELLTRRIRVELRDVDGRGLAQAPAFLRWMEETEYAFLRDLGMSVSMRDDRGQYGFPRLQVSLEVGRSLPLDAEADVSLSIRNLSARMIVYDFLVRPAESGPDDPIVARGTFQVACCRFPAEGQPYAILIPDRFLERLDGALAPGGSGPPRSI